jgi:hypothetical protein
LFVAGGYDENLWASGPGSDWRLSRVGLFGGMVLIETFSSNVHDKSIEAAMTGAFVIGPLVAVAAVIVVLVFRSRHAQQ